MDPKDFKKEMDKLVLAVKKTNNLKKIGDFCADLIRKRTRLGYGVRDQGGSKEKLKALSAKYKTWRKTHPPSGPTTASKSNLTYTGEMLDAIDSRVSGTTITIGIFDDDEAEKAFWNMLNDREFMNLSQAEIDQVGQYIEKLLDAEISKL